MLAWIALHDGQLFVQPAGQCARACCTTARRSRARSWLRAATCSTSARGRLKLRLDDGRRVLEVVAGGAGNPTAPPAPASVADARWRRRRRGRTHRADRVPRPVDAAAQAERPAVPWRRIAIGAALARARRRGCARCSRPCRCRSRSTRRPSVSRSRAAGRDCGSARNHLLRPGAYQLVAEREGYATLRVPVQVTEARDQRLSYTLSPLPGRLEITLPVAGRVRIDGRDAGAVPGDFELPAGKHTLVDQRRALPRLHRRRGHRGPGRLQKLAVAAHAGLGQGQRSASEPSGAEVRIGGEAARPHAARARTAGGFASRRTAPRRVQALGDRRAGAAEPAADARPGAARPARTDARRAQHAGRRQRQRRRRLPRPHAGRDRRAARHRAGGDACSATATSPHDARPASRAGERREVPFTLTPILGEVMVTARAGGRAAVRRRRARGTPARPSSLPATAHDIEIRRPGYATHRATVTPRPGLPQSINVAARGRARAAEPGTAPAGDAGAATAAASAATAGRCRGRIDADRPHARRRRSCSWCRPASTRWAARAASPGAAPTSRSARWSCERRFYLGTREVTNAEFRQFRPRHRSGFVAAEHARTRPPAGGQRDLAGCGGVLQLAERAGRPAAGVRVAGRPAGAGAARDDRLPPADRGRMGMGGARDRDGRLRKYPWGDALPVPAGAGNFADRQGAAAAADDPRGLRRRLRGARRRSAASPRIRSASTTSAATSPSGRTTSTLCSLPAAAVGRRSAGGGAGAAARDPRLELACTPR